MEKSQLCLFFWLRFPYFGKLERLYCFDLKCTRKRFTEISIVASNGRTQVSSVEGLGMSQYKDIQGLKAYPREAFGDIVLRITYSVMIQV